MFFSTGEQCHSAFQNKRVRATQSINRAGAVGLPRAGVQASLKAKTSRWMPCQVPLDRAQANAQAARRSRSVAAFDLQNRFHHLL